MLDKLLEAKSSPIWCGYES